MNSLLSAISGYFSRTQRNPGKTSPLDSRRKRNTALPRRLEKLEDRLAPAINVAVVNTGGVSDDSGFTALANQLNDDTFFDFTAVTVNASQVDTAAELNAYKVVVIGS